MKRTWRGLPPRPREPKTRTKKAIDMTQTPASHASTTTQPPIYLEDPTVGDQFTSGEHAMDEAQITSFAAQFDPQPFHLDDAQQPAIPCLAVWQPVAGTRPQSPCVCK